MDNFAEVSRRFKTLDGHCYVLKDRMVITRDREIGLVQALLLLRRQHLKMGVFSTSAAFSTLYAAIEFANSNLYRGAVYISLGMAFGLLIRSTFYSSKVVSIKFQDIASINFYGSRFGRKHSFFEIVRFNYTHTICTEIYLPAPKDSEEPNTQQALEVMDAFLK